MPAKAHVPTSGVNVTLVKILSPKIDPNIDPKYYSL
jgi:hypothetical protein